MQPSDFDSFGLFTYSSKKLERLDVLWDVVPLLNSAMFIPPNNDFCLRQLIDFVENGALKSNESIYPGSEWRHAGAQTKHSSGYSNFNRINKHSFKTHYPLTQNLLNYVVIMTKTIYISNQIYFSARKSLKVIELTI